MKGQLKMISAAAETPEGSNVYRKSRTNDLRPQRGRTILRATRVEVFFMVTAMVSYTKMRAADRPLTSSGFKTSTTLM